jgi:hypothetical protein
MRPEDPQVEPYVRQDFMPDELREYIVYGTPMNVEVFREIASNADRLAYQMHFFDEEIDLLDVPNPEETLERVAKMAKIATEAEVRGFTVKSDQRLDDRRTLKRRAKTVSPLNDSSISER